MDIEINLFNINICMYVSREDCVVNYIEISSSVLKVRRQMIMYTNLEPRQHEFPGRKLGLPYLVSDDKRPYQAQYQFQISICNIDVTCEPIKQFFYIFQSRVEIKSNILRMILLNALAYLVRTFLEYVFSKCVTVTLLEVYPKFI